MTLLALAVGTALASRSAHRGAVRSTAPAAVPGEVVAKFRPTLPRAEVERVADQCGLAIVDTTNILLDAAATSPHATGKVPARSERLLRNTFLLRTRSPSMRSRALKCLRRQRQVTWAELNYLSEPAGHRAHAYPDDPLFLAGEQWGLLNAGQDDPAGKIGRIDADVDVVQAWDLGHTDCRRIVVAVFDTGVDLAHPELDGNLWTNAKEMTGVADVDDDENGVVDDVHGFDLVDVALFPINQPPFYHYRDVRRDGPQDTLSRTVYSKAGHGTAVAGVIAAEGDNHDLLAGVCWQAQLMILRVGPPFSDWKFAQAANYVVTQRAFGHDVRIVNFSVSGPTTSESERSAVARLGENNILLVTGAGNADDALFSRGVDIDREGSERYPCSLPDAHVLCVASSDSRDALAAHSNYGATSVDLGAPGENIIALRRTMDGGGVTPAPGVDGTSLAAPHVTGIAALALARFPAKSALEVKEDILVGAAGLRTPASGVDRIRQFAGLVASGGRLRWPYTGDLGDAPPSYLTIAAASFLEADPTGTGALHWDVDNEFFGTNVTPEFDAHLDPPFDPDGQRNLVDRDFADEPSGPGHGGFAFFPPPPWAAGTPVKVRYEVCSHHFGIRDDEIQVVGEGRYLGGDPDRALYVNAWFDLDHDGTFEKAELLLTDVLSPPPSPAAPVKPGFPNVSVNLHPVLAEPTEFPVFPPRTRCTTISSTFTVPAPGGEPEWIRFRLDYGEDAGANSPAPLFEVDPNRPPAAHAGRARHGEVEDFRPGEVDRFESSLLRVLLQGPFGQEEVALGGTTTLYVGVPAAGDATDPDGDGLDQVPVELVAMDLVGQSGRGPARVRLRGDDGTGGRPPSRGEIEEQFDAVAGRLDVPPFGGSGRAAGVLDLFLDVELGGLRLHNLEPLRLSGEITFKPAAPGESYSGATAVLLVDEGGRPSGYALDLVTLVPAPLDEPPDPRRGRR